MNWQKAAIEDLKQYPYRKESLENIACRIAALKSKYEAVRITRPEQERIEAGQSTLENTMLDNIVERQRLGHTYKAVSRLVQLTERGLSGLGPQDRMVLERFYVDRAPGHVEGLMDKLGYEQSQIYRMKDAALYRFTVSMYGLTEY